MISSLEEYDGIEESEAGDGGGRSGSRGRAPGPVDEPERRRRLLYVAIGIRHQKNEQMRSA